MYAKRIMVLGLITMALLTLSGCYDKIEVEDLGIVRLTGIDWNAQTDKYEVTVNVQRPFSASAAVIMGKNTGSQTPWIASAEGDSIMDAFKNLRARASSNLSWQHSTIIILGKSLADKGISEAMDFFMRNREIRYTSRIFVSEGDAKDLMKITPETETSLAQQMDGIIKNVKNEWNGAYVPDLREVAITFSNKQHSSIIGAVKTVKPTPFNFQEGEEVVGIKPSKDAIALSGSAIIKDYKLTGWLDKTETRGYRWIKGNIAMADVDIFYSRSIISLEFDKAKSRVNVDIKDNKVYVEINTETTGHIIEALDKENFISEDGIKRLEKIAAEQIKGEMLNSINKAKMLDSDIFGFGMKIKESNPKEWKNISEIWNDHFKEAVVSIHVTAHIKTTGVTSKTVDNQTS